MISLQRRGITHLHIDVEVVIARPRRHAVLFDPRPLKSSGSFAFGVRIGAKTVKTVTVNGLDAFIVKVYLWNAPPVFLPPRGRFLFYLLRFQRGK
ncbi:hypothetical protein SDC9_176829 [bioreactor metagenome]|uniref:Uncharacterized protein n=1 Tax=bioreactor metagenome TaxID=1076179 RepID=A0A645GT29_9ZZZZ